MIILVAATPTQHVCGNWAIYVTARYVVDHALMGRLAVMAAIVTRICSASLIRALTHLVRGQIHVIRHVTGLVGVLKAVIVTAAVVVHATG